MLIPGFGRRRAASPAGRGPQCNCVLVREHTDNRNHEIRDGDTMGVYTTKDGADIFYKDWGSGQPVVFSHGWPLTSDDWDAQMLFFLHHGYRVIAHDRRGHGR